MHKKISVMRTQIYTLQQHILNIILKLFRLCTFCTEGVMVVQEKNPIKHKMFKLFCMCTLFKILLKINIFNIFLFFRLKPIVETSQSAT